MNSNPIYTCAGSVSATRKK